MEIECYKDLMKTIEGLTDLKKNLALDLSGELKVLRALSREFKKVYSVVDDFRKAEELFKSLKELGVQNVGIIVSETIPEFGFRFNLAVSPNTLNEAELEKLKSFSDFVLLINWEWHQSDTGAEKSFELIKNRYLNRAKS